MSAGMIPIKKAIPIIVVAWILSLVTTLALVYVSPSIFPPLNTANLNDDAVVANKIADGAIITTKLADGTITSSKILDGTITAVDIADGSILAIKVADGAVTTAKIADGGVSSAKVADGAIVTVKLADGSVTSAKILDGTITALDLADGAVTAIKIADGAVTASKIADFAVTNLKLAAGAIPFNATYAVSTPSTTLTSWADMPDMEVSLKLNRVSDILIMFSSEAWVSAAGAANMILVRAVFVNETGTFEAIPPSGTSLTILTKEIADDMGTRSFNFYVPSADTTVSTVKIQWRLWNAGPTGYVRGRTLAAIALPA